MILMRLTETFLVLPGFLLALILVAFFGGSIWNIIIVIGIVSWTPIARVVRAEFLSLKERPFVEGLKALGLGDLKIIFSEILPNALPPVMVNVTLSIASANLMEASLSFLGAGDPNQVSWGIMLQRAQIFLHQAWWMMVFPGIALFLAVLAVNMVGDGLNDVLNPRVR